MGQPEMVHRTYSRLYRELRLQMNYWKRQLIFNTLTAEFVRIINGD